MRRVRDDRRHPCVDVSSSARDGRQGYTFRGVHSGRQYCKLNSPIKMALRALPNGVISTPTPLFARRQRRTNECGDARMPTKGVHDPSKAYAPSSPMAWGPMGEWNMKLPEHVDIEEQYERTRTTEGFDGRIDHDGALTNHEVRLKDEDSKFVPNVKNFAPRPKNWKAGKHKNSF